jgi:hypothetical protein
MEDACKGDARTLLLNIKNYRPPPEVGTWALTKRQQISVCWHRLCNATSFNHFRTWWTLYNEQCESPDPPQVAVSVYMAAVRKLGDSISGKLDYELLRTGAGPADIDKVISAIKTVLTRHAATELTGAALQMGARHDPRRNVNPPKGARKRRPKFSLTAWTTTARCANPIRSALVGVLPASISASIAKTSCPSPSAKRVRRAAARPPAVGRRRRRRFRRRRGRRPCVLCRRWRCDRRWRRRRSLG